MMGVTIIVLIKDWATAFGISNTVLGDFVFIKALYLYRLGIPEFERKTPAFSLPPCFCGNTILVSKFSTVACDES